MLFLKFLYLFIICVFCLIWFIRYIIIIWLCDKTIKLWNWYDSFIKWIDNNNYRYRHFETKTRVEIPRKKFLDIHNFDYINETHTPYKWSISKGTNSDAIYFNAHIKEIENQLEEIKAQYSFSNVNSNMAIDRNVPFFFTVNRNVENNITSICNRQWEENVIDKIKQFKPKNIYRGVINDKRQIISLTEYNRFNGSWLLINQWVKENRYILSTIFGSIFVMLQTWFMYFQAYRK